MDRLKSALWDPPRAPKACFIFSFLDSDRFRNWFLLGFAVSHIDLEICIGSLEDGIVSSENGADRLELNSALEMGGLTPSIGVLEELIQAVEIPVLCMVRPRTSGFLYEALEIRTMIRDAERFLEAGAAGIVVGFLEPESAPNSAPNQAVDIQKCQMFRQVSRGKELVFHRAIDWVTDPQTEISKLVDIGVDRILTSGQQPRAIDGAGNLRTWIEKFPEIEFLPASGIKPANVGEILAQTSCQQIHAGLRTEDKDDSVPIGHSVRFKEGDQKEEAFSKTDPFLVRQMRDEIDLFAESMK